MDVSNERSYPTPYANSPLLPVLLISLAMQKHSPTTKTEFRKEYDYIVVGAGSAGAVVASRLSEMSCVSVLLLEAGKAPPRLTDVPALGRNFIQTDIDWQYKTTSQRYTGAALNDRKFAWSGGKTLGGSSTIDTLLYVRGNRRNYDEWAELGAEGWSYEDVLPFFKKLEDNTDPEYLENGKLLPGGIYLCKKIAWFSGKTLGGTSTFNALLNVRGNRRNYDEWAKLGAEGWSYADVLPYFKKLEDNTDPEYLENGFHAAGGPVTVSRPAYNPKPKLAQIDAVRDLGYEFVDSNAFEQVGFYDFQGIIRKGQRCGTAKAYLVPAENRTNLDIVANARVTKILIENKEAVGVELLFNGSTRKVMAKREVILSAGTTNTAQLLMLSGIGPMSELLKHNISLVADLPVGLNLQDHPLTFIFYELNSSIPSFQEEIENEDNVQEYIYNRTGPLTACEGAQLMSFLNKELNILGSNASKIPDYTVYGGDYIKQLPFQYNFKTEFLDKVVKPYANKTILFCGVQLLHPYSSGTVTIQSTNPDDQPVIDPNYFQDFRDIEDMVQGLKTCLSIFNHPEMERQLGAKPANVVIPGCEDFVEDEDLYLRCIVRTVMATVNHQTGTARMGDPKDPRTVVDPQLRVKGIRNLRVVDASIMPTIPWGNTNIPTIMVAEKASDIIKKTIECNQKSSN